MTPRSRRRWSDLSTPQRAAITATGVVQIALQVVALVDLRKRPRDEVKGPKPMWVALSFLNFLGPLAYFAFGRRR